MSGSDSNRYGVALALVLGVASMVVMIGCEKTTTGVKPREPVNHRSPALSCAGVFAPSEPVYPTSNGCQRHSDCTAGTNGHCVAPSRGTYRYQYCVYDECATDVDCEPGKVCYCSPSEAARCLDVGNCQTDADCGGGSYGYCSPAYGSDCAGSHGVSGYYCHTPKDTCIDDGDCTGKDYCDYDVIDGWWECKSPVMNCVVG